MSGSLNKVTIIGNIGNAPEIRNTQSGEKVANISVATSEKWKDRDGNQQERTEWHRVILFGKIAEIVEKYLAKGSKIYVEGKLQTRKWQDQSGQDRYTTEVVVSGFGGKLIMLGGKEDSQGHSNNQGGFDPQATGSDLDNGSYVGGYDDLDSEIPF